MGKRERTRATAVCEKISSVFISRSGFTGGMKSPFFHCWEGTVECDAVVCEWRIAVGGDFVARCLICDFMLTGIYSF